MNFWLMIGLMGLVTYFIRLSMIVLLGRIEIPVFWRHALKFVPAAVLAALILPALVQPAGQLDVSLGNARLLAGVIAAGVAWRTKNSLLTIAVGMAALWILQAVL